MGTALRELNKSLRNMISMRKMKGVTMLNSLEALGLSSTRGRSHPTGPTGVEAGGPAEPVAESVAEKNPASNSDRKSRLVTIVYSLYMFM
jgi:hypothetical protein